jgi:hypothetical protein
MRVSSSENAEVHLDQHAEGVEVMRLHPLTNQHNDPNIYPNFLAVAVELGADPEEAHRRAFTIAETEYPDDTPNLAAVYLRVLAEIAAEAGWK